METRQVTIMRSTWLVGALLLLSLSPALPAAAQSSSTSERDARARERDRERERLTRERRDDRTDDAATDDDEDDADDEADRPRGRQDRASLDTTIAFGRGGVVDLSLISGDIKVVGWGRSEARVRARAEEGGTIRFEASPSRLSLDLEGRGGRHGGHQGDAHYELSVPEGTRVLMRSTSGDLAARGVKGEVEARTISGDVTVEDAARRVEIESVSGDVAGARLAGDVRAHSVSGDVQLTDVGGDVDMEAVSGNLTVRGARAKVARAETVSGDLTYVGTVDAAGRYDFHSHSGTLRLVLPAGTNAALSVETFSGQIDSAFPLTLRPSAASEGGRKRPRRLEFTLGSGGPRITAETFSGDVVIERPGR